MQRALSRNPPNPNPSGGDPNHLGPVEAILSCLWVLTPLTATVSLLVVLVAILTNQWLHTEEKMSNPSYNGTGDKEYLSKFTISGLWMLCCTNPGEVFYECNRIDYFPQEEYSPDPNDSTLAIPYTVTKSAIFFASAAFLLCSGYCCAIIGQCARHKTFCTFVSGVLFIVTGLVMLFGLIMYISIFKAEIGSKLRPRSQLQPPPFDYWYGYSFILYVGGFVSTQFAGISAIFLFIYKMQYTYQRKKFQDCRHGKNHQPSVNYVNFDHTMYYPCRRHPQAYINSNSAIHLPLYAPSPIRQKRYFFSKETNNDSPCSVHRVQGNSLKNSVSSFYDFPPPPTISYQFDDHLAEGGIRHFPRDTTTTTVSTTADVNCDEFIPEEFEDYSPSMQHEHDFVTFDLDQPLPLRHAHSNISINSRNGCNKKSLDSDTLRRTTPV